MLLNLSVYPFVRMILSLGLDILVWAVALLLPTGEGASVIFEKNWRLKKKQLKTVDSDGHRNRCIFITREEVLKKMMNKCLF